MEQTDIDLHEIFRILRRRWWVLVTIPLIAGLVAGIVSVFVLQPVYQASTTLWVVKEGAGPISYNDVLLSRNLTKTYAEVARSRAVMLQVVETLQLQGLSLDALQAKLTVTPVRDTEILSFAITDTNPQTAATLADAVAEAFKAQILKSTLVDNVTIIDPALVDPVPIGPRSKLNVALAVVLGGMAALGLIFLLEFLDTTIKTPADVDRYLGLTVLGVIPVITPAAGTVPVSPGRRTRNKASQAQAVTNK